MISQEIRKNTLEPILEDIKREMAKAGVIQTKSTLKVLTRMAEAVWTKLKVADDFMINAYRTEDEIFRMATYMRRRSLGDSPQDAATLAREQFLDYDIRAPWVNAVRRSALPFISYTYRAAPVIAKSLSARPWKLAKYFTMFYAANAAAYMIAPGDEDEERRTMREQEQGYTWVRVPRMLRMPWRDKYGNPVFLDIRRWIPAGDIFDMNQGSAAIAIPAWLQLSGPIMLAFEIALNKQAFTGREIINEKTDDIWDKSAKILDWGWKSWMPSAAWIPGSWYFEKIRRAAKGARDYEGHPYSVPQAVVSSVGIKLKPHDIDTALDIWGLEVARTERELNSQSNRLVNDLDRGLIDQKTFDQEQGRIDKKFDKLDNKDSIKLTGKPLPDKR